MQIDAAASRKLSKAMVIGDPKPIILHVITSLGTGGAEAMLARLVQADNSFRHIVVSLIGGGMWRSHLYAAGIEATDLGMKRGIPSPIALWRLARLIRFHRPILVQTWLYHADLLGFLAARLTGRIPVVWNLRCSDMNLGRHDGLTWLVVRILAWLSPLTKAVIVNSEAGRNWHVKLGYRPPRWEFLPNGIDTVQFRPSAEARRRWRERLGISQAAILVGMAARRDAMKDHEGLLKAAELLPEDIGFVMVGPGVTPDDPTLATKRGAIYLLGRCSDMPGFFSALDIAVLASLGEGFPNVVAEAMACGVPCVVTDVGDAATIVSDTGKVVPARDPRALAEAINELVGQPLQRAHMGRMARKRIVERYDLSAITKRYQSFWADIVAAQKFLSKKP